MAIMDAFKDWCQYFMGVEHKIKVFTDHQNLKYFKKTAETQPLTG